MFRALWLKLKETWPVNRVVVALTPIVFVPAAGFVSTWVAQHFPGIPPIDPGWLAAIFIAGGAAALTAAYKWLEGWQQYEAHVADPASDPILAPSHKDPPPERKESGQAVPANGGADIYDEDAELSLPDDIAESDVDPAEAAERRQRIPDTE